jgi:signal transduction histidine kinase
MTYPERLHAERDRTDESLQLERDRTDRAFDDELSEAEDTADALISRARARADALLAAARLKSDQTAGALRSSDAVLASRAVADRVVERERATADQDLEDSRVAHAAFLSDERKATDQDLSNERARSDHALAMRDEFMGIVSHDLLNLLNAIVGMASLIEREVVQEDAVERVIGHARRVQRSGARMARLVGDLVDVASIEAGKLAVTRTLGDPAEVVAEAVETFQAQAVKQCITLTADIASGLPPVAFDAARILQVLCNLVNNALKFTPPQGSIVVRLERVDDAVVGRVSDDGEGIPDDKLEAVFDRFVQLTRHDRRGVGLGLFIAKCIVSGHGGRIWAENRPGGGSTFSFTLPIS